MFFPFFKQANKSFCVQTEIEIDLKNIWFKRDYLIK